MSRTSTTTDGLRPETATWLEKIQGAHSLTEGGAVLLLESAKLRDRIAEADEAVARDGFMIPTRGAGAPRVHPAVKVAADARGLLLRYLSTLGLEAEV